MKKFSWFTLKEKYELNGCYVTNKVHNAGTPFEYSECVKHYRPNMKGGHTHNHVKNRELRLMLTKKEIKALRKIMKREKNNGRN